MKFRLNIPQLLRRFSREDRGAALVEFAILLPVMLLIFAVIIEGARMFWAYQTTVAGVRDASRYLARIVPANVCITNTTQAAVNATVTGYAGALQNIVANSHGSSLRGNVTLFPAHITINSVTPAVKCVTGTYRLPNVAVAQVTASLTITFPFAGVFSFAGQSLSTINTTVLDETRIFGI